MSGYFVPELATQDEIKPRPVAKYNLKVVGGSDEPSKSGGKMVMLEFAFPDHPEAPTFKEYLWIPNEGHDPMARRRQWVRIKRVKAVFGLDPNDGTLSYQEFMDRTGESPVTVEKQDGFEPVNKIDPPPFE